ncbi:hypothetical protein [Clostridium estertheticum]|uniref:hypothetical protein n=1 Tax=Clostridium estertheticum TaxID=238834 RepID=UPI001CF3A1C0|nr:hypothetical protein [Clostridium estertheticum]MCB2360947.1 hypothetical protein [Clostridium estertheticum]
MPNNLEYINCKLNVHSKEGTECGYLNTNDCPKIKLTDNQAIVIIDNDISIMG